MTSQLSPLWTLEKLRAERAAIIALAQKYGAFNVRVFGSVARHESHTTSDIDFLVSVDQGVSIFNLVGLWLDLQDLLGCEVDLCTDEGLKPSIRSRVLKDAIAL